MPKAFIPYGNDFIEVNIPSKNYSGLILPNEPKSLKNFEASLENSLLNPIEREDLVKSVKGFKRAVIIVNDATRPTPTKLVLPSVLRSLRNSGLSRDKVFILIATGIHRPSSVLEKEFIVGRGILKRVKVLDHDAKSESSIYIGKSKFGNDLYVNSLLEDSFLISIGNVEQHWFAGYTGGAKSILPGVSAYESIEGNHSLMLRKGSESGVIEGNPVREEIDEAGFKSNLNFIINLVLNSRKEVAGVFAGDFIKAHREAVKNFNRYFTVKFNGKADIVIVSPGGYPKDINLYQAQKALENASKIVNEGGVMILIAECREGYGNKLFEDWIKHLSPEEIEEKLREKFVLGGHKAYGFVKLLKKIKRLILVSSIDKSELNLEMISYAKNVREAIKESLEELGGDSSIAVIPYASITIPLPRGV